METEAIEPKPTVISSIMAEAETETAESTEGAETTESTETTDTSTSDQSEGADETEETAATETEGEEEASTEEASEDSSESDDAPALPEKQAKSYSKELTEHYAQRFGWTSEQVAEDKGKGYAIKKAIDADIHIQQQNARLAALESQETEEEEAAEEVAEVAPARVTPEQRAEYTERLSSFAKEINDPEMVAAYAGQYCKAMGLSPADYEKATGVKPEEFVHQQTMYLANAVNTMLPRLLPSMMSQLVEQVFPGFAQMYEGALTANTWEEVRSSDANFKSLAAFGTPEYDKAVKDAINANPWIDQMKFVDQKTGRELSRPKALAARYRVVAQLLTGRVSPETIRQAVATGKKEASGHTRKVTASRSLGAGKSKGTFQAPKKDEFREAILQFNADQKSSPVKE